VIQVKIKICGLTRIEDVENAVAAGVDAIGFVFTASPRRVSAQQAAQLCRFVPDDVLRVGLFLNQSRDEVTRVLKVIRPNVLQFHGSESEQFCLEFGIPYLKAVAIKDEQSVPRAECDYPSAMGLLLDSHKVDKPGGSGKVFDWSLPQAQNKQIWLAGGLNADNVSAAIRTVKPYAVDVSSGVEVSPGIKDVNQINAFVLAVRKAAGQVHDERESSNR
jgi:phosphoribosylanthranilate isomerase